MKRRDLLRAALIGAGMAGGLPLAAMARAKPVGFYELRFPDLHGHPKAVSDFLGKPMVLNFWATWCPPCVKEMPDLDFLHRKHDHVHVVGVAIDTAANVVKFNEKVSVSYPLLVAGHGGIRLMKELGNPRGGLPFTIVFDAAGQPQEHFLGQIDRDDLDAILDGLQP